jgi:hypothetical protein
MYWKYRNNKVKGKYVKTRDILMTEFGAGYISENRVYRSVRSTIFNSFYLHVFIYDVFSNAFISGMKG